MKNFRKIETGKPKMSAANSARLAEMLDTPIEDVADADSLAVMCAAFNKCVGSLAASKSEEQTCHVIGQAFKVLFMLGRASALN